MKSILAAVVVALLSVNFALSTAIALPYPAPLTYDPQIDGEGYHVIFDDCFDQGYSQQWFFAPDWAVMMELGNGFLNAPSSGTTELVTPIIRSDYHLMADLRLWDGSAYLSFRKSLENGYRLKVASDGLILVRLNGGNMTHLANATMPVTTRVWHTIEIGCVSEHIRIFVDGSLQIEVVDPEPQYAGSIALEAAGNFITEVDFDNIIVFAKPPEMQNPPWVQTGGPVGGPITTVEIDPNDPNILYAGGGDGNVFKTVDAGVSWTLLPRPEPLCTCVECLIVSSADSQTIFASILNESGAGTLYRSANAGERWEPLFPGTDPWITCFAIDQSEPLNLAAGTFDGQVMVSSDGGDTWADFSANLPGDAISDITITPGMKIWAGTSNGCDGRLFYSSDTDVIWKEISIFGKPLNTDINSIFVDTLDANIVYIGLEYTLEGQAPPECPLLYKSVDNGQSWSNIYLPDPGKTVDVLCNVPGTNAVYVANGCYLYKDNGKSWKTIPVQPIPDGNVSDMAIDPSNSDVLFLPRISGGMLKSIDAGDTWVFCEEGILNTHVQLVTLSNDPGISNLYVSAGMEVFKSSDNGKVWNHTAEVWTHQTPGEIHPAPAALQTSPFDPETVWYISNVGQVYKTQDGAVTWNKLADPFMLKNNDAETGFRFGSIYALAVAPSDPYTLYASKKGFGIFKSTHNGRCWTHLSEAEVDYTSCIAVDPTNPDVVYSGTLPKPFEKEAVLRQTDDGGITWRTTLTIPDSTGITSVAIDPGNPDTVYAGSTGQGGIVWSSLDAGDTWSIKNDHFNFTNVHSFAVDPSNVDVAFAGVWGGGTFMTSDAGQTWTRYPADETDSVMAIMVDSINADTIYVGDRMAPNIYHTLDGGVTWDTFFYPGPLYYRTFCAALAPGDPTVMYASFLKINEPMAGDLFRLDNGVSTCVTGTLPRMPVAITIDPMDADTVYAILHANGIYKTSDGGATWTEISGASSGLPQDPEVGFNGLVIDPSTSGRLYLVGGCDVDLNYMHTGVDPFDMNTVYKSTDGGATWTNLNDGMLGANSNAVKGLAIAPFDPDVLYIGCLNGVFRSIDAGATWEDISTGLGFLHTAGAVLNSTGTRLYIPTLGGGTYGGTVDTISGDVVWDNASQLIADIHHVQVLVDHSNSSTLYASAFPGGIFKSQDGGATWAECNFGIPSFTVHDPKSEGYYSIAQSQSNPDLLYLGMYRKGIYKSADGGGIWKPSHGVTMTMIDKPITSLIIDPVDNDLVYAGTTNGFYLTTDGGGNWLVASAGLDCPDVRTLVLSSNGILYAGTRGHEVYSCDTRFGINWNQEAPFGNFGQDWQLWDTTLYQATTILFSPSDPNLIYMGTFPTGFFVSLDAGQTWHESTYGLGQVGIFTLEFHPDDERIILAGTSNGIMRLVRLNTQFCGQWSRLDNGWPEQQWVLSIGFDPIDSDIMYACTKDGHNKGRGVLGAHGTVMKSTNAGWSWFPITTGLNVDQEFYEIIADPYESGRLYLATQHEGIFISHDGGALWKPWNEGLTFPEIGGTCMCDPLNISVDGLYIFLGTNGSGVYRRQLCDKISR